MDRSKGGDRKNQEEARQQFQSIQSKRRCPIVAPWLRATGLPCIASPEIKSSGNTQQLGTGNNRFIDLLWIHRFDDYIMKWGQAGRTMQVHLCTLFSKHNMGLGDRETSTRQRNNDVAELHITGTLLGHGLDHDEPNYSNIMQLHAQFLLHMA
jgi:hypothetical protein